MTAARAEADAAGCAVVTGVGAVLNVMGAAAAPGAGVLVIGAGGVGLSVLLGAVMAGAYPVIVADVSEARLDLARSLGASHTINTTEHDLGPRRA